MHYQLYKETGKEEEDCYAMIETWESQKHLDAHCHTEHVRLFRESQLDNGSADVKVYVKVKEES